MYSVKCFDLALDRQKYKNAMLQIVWLYYYFSDQFESIAAITFNVVLIELKYT